MRVLPVGRTAALAAAVLLVGACSGGGSTSSPAGNGQAASGGSASAPAASGGASAAPAAASGSAGGGNAGSLNACNFLTTSQIQSIVGWPVGAGALQNTDTQSDCEWSGPSGESGVGLTISNYDAVLWQAGSSAGNSTAVSGVGDAAFKGWPHGGDLTIKVKGYQVAIAIIDFAAAPAKVDAENLSLAALVLPKL